MHTYMHICIHTLMHTYKHTCIHLYIHTYTIIFPQELTEEELEQQEFDDLTSLKRGAESVVIKRTVRISDECIYCMYVCIYV
jgi:hypothetical protein